jgi:hypothetical protein
VAGPAHLGPSSISLIAKEDVKDDSSIPRIDIDMYAPRADGAMFAVMYHLRVEGPMTVFTVPIGSWWITTADGVLRAFRRWKDAERACRLIAPEVRPKVVAAISAATDLPALPHQWIERFGGTLNLELREGFAAVYGGRIPIRREYMVGPTLRAMEIIAGWTSGTLRPPMDLWMILGPDPGDRYNHIFIVASQDACDEARGFVEALGMDGALY